MKLRYYQELLYSTVVDLWGQGYKNVMVMATTGAGKTPIIGEAVRRHAGIACVIAHRDNLVLQLSRMLAGLGIKHRVIASDKTQRAIASDHMKQFKRVFLDPNARVAAASAQTLAKRDNLAAWCASVTLWVIDEAHHATKGTVWGRCIERFTHPQCRGLLPTATPGRADGKGLGSHHDGYADVMAALVEDGDVLGVRVVKPGESIICAPAKLLMKPCSITGEQYLSGYKVACVESHIAEFLGEVAASGDWSQATLKSASQKSTIVGDVVESFKKFGEGKTGITFTTDVETAGDIAKAYRAAGISAEVITGETDPIVRAAIFERLGAKTLRQVVAIDVISEGTDIPAVDCITLARPTASLGLWLQMIGRGLRMAAGKAYCQLIDHVGNFLRHRGGPDTPREWSLNRRDKRAAKKDDAVPLRICLNVTCGQPYERNKSSCPFCGTAAPEPEGRGTPDQVEGVLALLDDETLARLRGELPESEDDYAARLLASGLPGRFVGANLKRHRERLAVLDDLKEMMGLWGGIWHARGETDAEIQRRFYHVFGLDVFTAQTLDREAAENLLKKVIDATVNT